MATPRAFGTAVGLRSPLAVERRASDRGRRRCPIRCARRSTRPGVPRPSWWPSTAGRRDGVDRGPPPYLAETTEPPWRTSLMRHILRPQPLISNCLGCRSPTMLVTLERLTPGPDPGPPRREREKTGHLCREERMSINEVRHGTP